MSVRDDVDARGERFLFALGPREPSPIVVAIGWGPSAGPERSSPLAGAP